MSGLLLYSYGPDMYCKLSYKLHLYHSTSIPFGIQNFMGREEELQNISNIIRFRPEIKHVMLVGAPGFGKSTLAIHAAHECMKYGFIVYYIDMDEVQTVFGVTQQILKCAEISTNSPAPERVIKWARDLSYPVILVLDNCDSVIHRKKAEFQNFIRSILDMSMNLKLITTSREAIAFLNVESHHRYVVNELSEEDATLLLHAFGNMLTDEEKKTIAILTGCSPLALQVIGSIFKGLAPPSPSDIIKQLSTNPIRALSPDQLEKQVNISIYLSYKYLDSKVKIIGHYLAYFPGSFDETVACDILGLINSSWQCEKVNFLSVLVQRSLVKYNDRSRRYQFHVLIKEFFRNIQITDSDTNTNFNFYFIRYYTNFLYRSVDMSKKDVAHVLRRLDAEKHNVHLFLNTICETGYIHNTSLLVNITAVFNKALKGNLLQHHFTQSELIKPATVLLRHIERLQSSKFGRQVSNVTYFQLYVQLVLNLESLLNTTSEKFTLLESKHEMIKSIRAMLNDADSAATYSLYISILADHYYKQGNHSAVRLCHAKLQKQTRILQDCSPSECQYSVIALNYQRVGDIKNSNKFFEAALKHEILLPLSKARIYGFVFDFHSKRGNKNQANIIADETAQLLPDILASKSELQTHVNIVIIIIKNFKKMGKYSEADTLLKHVIDTLENAGSFLREESLVEYLWSLAATQYNKGNYSTAFNTAVFVYKHHYNNSNIEVTCIQLLIGLASYHLGNVSDSISNLSNLIHLRADNCQGLLVESCFYLLLNMKWNGYRECLVYPISTHGFETVMQIFNIVFSSTFSMPISSTPMNANYDESDKIFTTNEITTTHTSVQPLILQPLLHKLILTLQSSIQHAYEGVIELFSMWIVMWIVLFIVNCAIILLKLILACLALCICCCCTCICAYCGLLLLYCPLYCIYMCCCRLIRARHSNAV